MAQTPPIFSLPQDVIAEIYILLPLRSIASLRQCCRHLQQSISSDKQLWIRLVHRDVADRLIPIVPYHRTTNCTNTPGVESWMRNAITLEKAYESNLQLTLDHTIVPDRLSATWAKLIRGRWCLVATSNVYQSWLSLWDGGSTGRPLRMRYYLPGPVMDGLVEDTPYGVHLALSIGTRSPHIQVLRLAQWQGHIHMERLATIDGASHPKVLSGPVLGFAVRDGDDSFPQLINWISGVTCILGPQPPADPVTPNSLATIHSTCWAMAIWGDYIVAVFDSTVNIYRQPDVETTSTTTPLEVIPLRDSDAEVHVREAQCIISPHLTASLTGSGSPSPSSGSLGIICRNYLGSTFATTIHDLGTSQNPRFHATKHVWWDSNPEEPNLSGPSPMRVFIGLTRSKFIFYTTSAEGNYPHEPPKLFFTDIRLKRFLDSETLHTETQEVPYECFFGTSQQLPSSDLPLLHFHPYIDFDDARGVVLIASSRGEFWTARVLAEEVLTRDGIDDELPSVWPNSQIEHQFQPVPMDLPMYYKYRRDVESSYIPDELRVETIRTWYTPGCDNLDLPGWSNDWDAFPDFIRWVIPPLRWGYADEGFEDYHLRSIIALIRHDFRILGDPVPLLYDSQYKSVIFHVGQRIYLISEGKEERYNASQVLITLDEFSSDPWRLFASREHCIAPSLRDWNVHELQNTVFEYDVSVEHAALGDIDFELDPDPAKWTDDQWYDIMEEYTLWERSCKDRTQPII